MMNFYLFETNLKISFILAGIFLFILPIFIYKFKTNKYIKHLYLFSYFILLFMGVLLDISIHDSTIYFSVLTTNKWFSNKLVIANFAPFGVLVNLFLLFPFGFILPIIKHLTFYKVLLLGFLLTLTIEILQFMLPIIRYTELLDIINNTISVILGYQYYLLISKLMGREKYDRISK